MVRASINLIAVVILWIEYKSLQVDMTWGQMGSSNLAVSGGQSMRFKAGSQQWARRAEMGSSP